MGCALQACRRTNSENGSTIGESEQMLAASSQPSQPSRTSSVVEAEEDLIQPDSVPAASGGRGRTSSDQKVDIRVTDVRGSLVSLDLIALDVTASIRGKRFQLPRRAKTKYLSEDDAYIEFTKKRAARAPSAIALLKRNLFYRSFPLTLARRKSVEKRMRKQKLGQFEEKRYVFKGHVRHSGASSGSGSSREATATSVQSLPPGGLAAYHTSGQDTYV